MDKNEQLYFYNNQYEGGVCDSNVFVTGAVPEQQFSTLVTWMMEKYGKNVYTIAADYNFGQISAEWVRQIVKENGGTMVVPGSHLYGRHPDKNLDSHIKPIAAEGPPGCAIITDGRLWHGTGANVTEEPRIAIIITFCGPQFRPQENYTFGLRKDILNELNDFQKELLGFRVWNGYGRTGDPTQNFIDTSEDPIGILKL